MQKGYDKEKERPYPMHKAPTFVTSRRGHSSQPYPQFFFSLERLIPRLESTTCRFWWKTLSFAPRPGSTSKVQQIEIPKMPIIKPCNIKTMKYTYKGQYQHPLSEKGQSLFNPKSQLQSQFKPERKIPLKKQYYIIVLGSYVSLLTV